MSEVVLRIETKVGSKVGSEDTSKFGGLELLSPAERSKRSSARSYSLLKDCRAVGLILE